MAKPVITKKLADALALGVNGSYSNEGNALQHTLYDTFLVPATLQNTINYFTQPIGAAYANGNKTMNETNLSDPGKLPNGQTFLITAFSLALKANADDVAAASNELADDIMSAFNTIIGNSIFQIVIAGREFEYMVPGTELLPTVPLAVEGTAETVVSGNYWTSGWRKLNATPVVIGQLVSFSVRQTVNSQITAVAGTVLPSVFGILNGQAAEFQVRLGGYLTRSI